MVLMLVSRSQIYDAHTHATVSSLPAKGTGFEDSSAIHAVMLCTHSRCSAGTERVLPAAQAFCLQDTAGGMLVGICGIVVTTVTGTVSCWRNVMQYDHDEPFRKG